ncbi:MAG: hypothetical protein KDD94_04530 [Calditrichaeota bacterium]|nr:hypothetical protein [Calditrichota bacterium]
MKTSLFILFLLLNLNNEQLKIGLIPQDKFLLGCSCHFSLNKSDFDNKKTIYVDNLKIAYMYINEQLIEFKIDTTFSPDSISERKILSAKMYKLILEKTETSHIEESWMQKGKLILRRNDGVEISRDIYGECGC